MCRACVWVCMLKLRGRVAGDNKDMGTRLEYRCVCACARFLWWFFFCYEARWRVATKVNYSPLISVTFVVARALLRVCMG